MAESINARVNRLADGIDRQELALLLGSILTDLTAIKTSLNQLRADHNSSTTPTTAAAVTLNTTS
jgi:hypothetical protein